MLFVSYCCCRLAEGVVCVRSCWNAFERSFHNKEMKKTKRQREGEEKGSDKQNQHRQIKNKWLAESQYRV